VAGNIGSGKSTLVDFICSKFGIRPFPEPNASNPYLRDFYSDMKRWAFHSQIYFLAHKFAIHQALGLEAGTVVQDRTIYEDAEIFAENLHRSKILNDRDYRMYRDLYEIISRSLRPPDLLVYLRCPVRTLRRRIKLRGRPEEQAIPAAYLNRLDALYEEWFGKYALSPTLVIPTERLDYLRDIVHRADLLGIIERHL
jgi:deoxyadenosine/deoxycytidine kinase